MKTVARTTKKIMKTVCSLKIRIFLNLFLTRPTANTLNKPSYADKIIVYAQHLHDEQGKKFSKVQKFKKLEKINRNFKKTYNFPPYQISQNFTKFHKISTKVKK